MVSQVYNHHYNASVIIAGAVLQYSFPAPHDKTLRQAIDAASEALTLRPC